MSTGQEQVRHAIAEQAGAWFVANQSSSLDDAARAAFIAWLKASPIHVEEYLGVALLARDLPAASDDPTFSIESLVEDARSADDDKITYLQRPEAMPGQAAWRWPAARWQPIAAMAAAVVFAVTAVVWRSSESRLQGTVAGYETAHGEQGTWRLTDGSELRLNTDSSVSVRYSNQERLVELTRGQAHFHVARDSFRRFRVMAGKVETIATGTQFDVYRRADAVLVTVTEGQVAVIGQRKQRIDAGYQLRVDADGVAAVAVPVDVNQTLAWLKHRIAFDLRPLGEVADEFNRYGSLPLLIPDPALRALQISGVFDAGDTNSFVAFIETLEGIRVERTPTAIRVLRVTDEV
ncbi:MAG TPA: FecR domain-containing protein [Steroidobacteraceae bacterium]